MASPAAPGVPVWCVFGPGLPAGARVIRAGAGALVPAGAETAAEAEVRPEAVRHVCRLLPSSLPLPAPLQGPGAVLRVT